MEVGPGITWLPVQAPEYTLDFWFSLSDCWDRFQHPQWCCGSSEVYNFEIKDEQKWRTEVEAFVAGYSNSELKDKK